MCNDHCFRKSTAWLIAVLLLMLTLFSSGYIVIESEHECEGEDCHVCRILEVCEAILHETGTAFSSLPSAAFLFITIAILPVFISKVSINRTLFDLKVRLNN